MLQPCGEHTGWSKEQWWVLITLCATHFCNGMCVSLQAPFYPKEAEKKGATASEYGLVFGVFELTVFIISPLMGKYIPKIGAAKAFTIGISTTGSMCVAFGFLDSFKSAINFIAFSFLVRVIEACGNAAFLTASFSLVAQYFQHTVATVFALVEMAFGVGMILGPTVGGLLYQKGGYTLPFVVLGAILLVQASLSTVSFRKVNREHINQSSSELGIFKALTIPRVLLATVAVFSASISVGYLQATLERHLAQFSLTPVEVGLFFMAYGGAYAVPNPMWGWMADKVSPRLVTLFGSLLLSTGFILVGPIPWTGLKTSYNLIMVAVVMAGVGLGAQLVSAFTESQKCAINAGCPNDLTTYSLVSSLWTSAFALGAFVGPTVAGLLYDKVGYCWSTLFPAGCNLLVAVCVIIGLSFKYLDIVRKRIREREYMAIKGEDTERDVRKDSMTDYGYRSDSEGSGSNYNCNLDPVPLPIFERPPPRAVLSQLPSSASCTTLEASRVIIFDQRHSEGSRYQLFD